MPAGNKSDTDFQKLDEDEDFFTKLCCFSGNHNSFKQTIKTLTHFAELALGGQKQQHANNSSRSGAFTFLYRLRLR